MSSLDDKTDYCTICHGAGTVTCPRCRGEGLEPAASVPDRSRGPTINTCRVWFSFGDRFGIYYFDCKFSHDCWYLKVGSTTSNAVHYEGWAPERIDTLREAIVEALSGAHLCSWIEAEELAESLLGPEPDPSPDLPKSW